jgi:chromosome segregation protein
MTAPARLLALRLQGFKSFGERTIVEFGPGISAIVGPNGSGKSNLADALRWTLGEQGRALRLRKSEDVIFAGSEKRSALGMADVTLVLANSDRLLPIDFEMVELGRRLFRSGENDYLLNRQRVRLKDLVDLLDAAHLADNAFLFIGQGMVDQALALRPEERRPLFEEVAGVRRHERRKSRAEAQLLEADSNLARVEDVLAELRPQARRLAAQAEQQVSRQNAGAEYGRAVIDAARARWRDAATRAAHAGGRLVAARAQLDEAAGILRETEERAATVGRELTHGAESEADAHSAHEAARSALTELQLREARVMGDSVSIVRDRRRLDAERSAAEADLDHQRRELAVEVPPRDLSLAAAVAEADRDLAEALEELAAMRAAQHAKGEALAALRRVEAVRTAELETARRRLAEAERQMTGERARAGEAFSRRAEAEKSAALPAAALAAATEEEKAAVLAREQARAELGRLEGVRLAASERAVSTASGTAAMRGRLEATRARLSEDEARGIAKAARRIGGRPLAEGLDVEAGLRVAVESALGEAMRGFVVGRDAVASFEGQRGVLVIEPGAEGRRGSRDGHARGSESAEAVEAVARSASSHAGGRLAEAVRSDPSGTVARLLARALWVPDMTAALAVHPLLPPGWIVVTRGGDVVSAAGVVTVGRSESLLERRADLDRLVTDLERAEAVAATASGAADEATAAATVARAALDAARERERRASTSLREAEEAERRAARAVEMAAREAAWRTTQLARVEADRERLTAALAAAEGGVAGPAVNAATTGDGVMVGGDGPAAGGTAAPATAAEQGVRALREWEARAAALRSRRDALAAEEAGLEAVRREVDARRARAGAAAALDEARLNELERQAGELAGSEARLDEERQAVAEALAAAVEREAVVHEALARVRSATAEARARLGQAETAVAQARERVRTCQEAIRTSEVGELEARLALDSIREQVLVELAGMGDLGLQMLSPQANDEGVVLPLRSASTEAGSTDEETGNGNGLEAALTAAAALWMAGPEVEVPSQGRLASLRRRFHELGPPNPFAAEEYRTLKARLDGLEAQRADLNLAISKTRALIEQLNAMIATQFRTTFSALEAAFDARFRQLFGGGFARLSLTEPEDLASTGVEIVARPPGKKAQPLSMLSGGERALTAVALLFSMLEVHPVPFCVLDEVDAALDEANVGRFAEALRSLADETQFIVITHNRGTIEIADALYGVTVGDDAVSRVISLRLEEARELAGQVTGDRGPAVN